MGRENDSTIDEMKDSKAGPREGSKKQRPSAEGLQRVSEQENLEYGRGSAHSAGTGRVLLI